MTGARAEHMCEGLPRDRISRDGRRAPCCDWAMLVVDDGAWVSCLLRLARLERTSKFVGRKLFFVSGLGSSCGVRRGQIGSLRCARGASAELCNQSPSKEGFASRTSEASVHRWCNSKHWKHLRIGFLPMSRPKHMAMVLLRAHRFGSMETCVWSCLKFPCCPPLLCSACCTTLQWTW